jgi:hypothetical protein
MDINCDLCKQKLEITGALVFSPPDLASKVRKIHVCRTCWTILQFVLDDWANIGYKLS